MPGFATGSETDLSVVALLQYPTIRSLARHLSNARHAECRPWVRSLTGPSCSVGPSPGSAAGREEVGMSYSDAYDADDGVAIIGLAGRFPGARNVTEFWRNLVEGRETVSFFSDDELDPANVDEMAARRQPNYVRSRGILADAEMFDAAFFGITPSEAADPRPSATRVPGDRMGSAGSCGARPAQLRGAHRRVRRDEQQLVLSPEPPRSAATSLRSSVG